MSDEIIRELLEERLSKAGAKVHLHTDFDWRGLRFVDQLLSIPGSIPWRMDLGTYRAASGMVPLTGKPFEPDWAIALVTAMKKAGMAVYKEQILSQLQSDLEL